MFFRASFLFFIILLPPAQRMKPRALGKERGNMKEWAEWFYKSKEWAQTRDAYMTAQHYLCERCGEPAKIVHHKIWLTPKNIHEQSITLCWDNLEALCQDCHNKEHHAKNVRAKRYAFTADGELIPPFKKIFFTHDRPRGNPNFTLQGRTCVV